MQYNYYQLLNMLVRTVVIMYHVCVKLYVAETRGLKLMARPTNIKVHSHFLRIITTQEIN